MSGDFFDDDDGDSQIAGDFYSIIGAAQINELEAVEKQREKEREAAKKLAEESLLKANVRNTNAGTPLTKGPMTLTQIMGLKTQKEIEAMTRERDQREEKKTEESEAKRKADAEAKRLNQFPPPIL